MRLGNMFHTLFATLVAGLALMPAAALAGTGDVNQMTANLLDNSYFLPGLISVAAYLSGLALGVLGVLNIHKHVVAGAQQTPLRIPLIQLITSGMLLALPFTYEVLIDTAKGADPFNVAGVNFYADTADDPTVYMSIGGSVTEFGSPTQACNSPNYSAMIGGIMCTMWGSISNLPGLLSGFAYIAGLTMLYFAVIGLKQSVEKPGEVSAWMPFQRFVVATLLLILPYTLETLIQTLYPTMGAGQSVTDFNLTAPTSETTLDLIVGNFVFNIYGIMDFAIAGFGYIAGVILIIIGIFRLMKTMQDGPRGPGGIGTIMTFITGSALLAIGPTMGAFSTTLFGDNVSETNVDLTVPGGGLVEYEARMENFISAVLAYMLILGWISFVRGLFIFRGVAEGDQQASMMSAVTHLLAGALLVNMGPFLTAVQATIGPIPGLPGLVFS